MKRKLEKKDKDATQLPKSVISLRRSKFSYDNLKSKKETFHYLSGLSVEKCEMVWEIVSPYAHAIDYPDCVGTGQRSIDKTSELLAVLIICRHALQLGIMAYILNVGKSTVYRIFVGWIVFL